MKDLNKLIKEFKKKKSERVDVEKLIKSVEKKDKALKDNEIIEKDEIQD